MGGDTAALIEIKFPRFGPFLVIAGRLTALDRQAVSE